MVIKEVKLYRDSRTIRSIAFGPINAMVTPKGSANTSV